MSSKALQPPNGIEKYLSIQKYNFKCLGFDIISEEGTFLRPTLIWLPMALHMCLCILTLNYAAQCRADIYLMTNILASFWQSVLVLIKMWCFLWNKKRMVHLVRIIWLWSLQAHGEELDIIKEENKKERFYSLLFYRYVVATAAMALLSPPLEAGIYYLKGQGFIDNLGVPFKADYHLILDVQSCSGYLLTYFWNIIIIFFMLHAAVGNDTLFSWFAYNVAAQFRILNLRLKATAVSLRAHKNEKYFSEPIISHIKYHQRVIELANYFNEVFMVAVFFEYALSFLQIACVIFQIARVGEYTNLVFHILFLISVSIQLMLYCSGGQMIIDKSNSVADTIYEHFEWHEMSTKSREILLLPMMRAQTPSIVTGVFFVAHLPLFLWVFKTSASFFALLKSMDSQ